MQNLETIYHLLKVNFIVLTISPIFIVVISQAFEPTAGKDFHQLHLVRGKPIKVQAGSPLTVREVGLFVIIDTPFGLTIHWDKGTRIYVKLQRNHVNKVIRKSHSG